MANALPLAELRPLTTGALADRPFLLYKQHFTTLFLMGLLGQSVPVLIQLFITDMGLQKHSLSDPIGYALLRACEVLLLFMFSTLFSFWGAYAVTDCVSCLYLGRKLSVSVSIFRAIKSIPKTTWTFFLASLILVIPVTLPFFVFMVSAELAIVLAPSTFSLFLLLAVSILLVMAASLFPLLIAAMRLFLILPVAVVEGIHGWRAIVRSSRLVGFDPKKGILYWGEMRLSFLLLPLFIIQILFLMFSFTSTWLIDRLLGTNDTLFASMDSAAIPNVVLLSLTSALLFPVTALAYTFFYFDVRARSEAFDLIAACQERPS